MWGEAPPPKPNFQASKPPNFLISFWRRKVGRGRAHDRAPGVSAPSFLQDLRLCGSRFPRTLLGAPSSFPLPYYIGPSRGPKRVFGEALKGPF